MTDTELDELEAKAKAATSGPWILGASLLIYGPKHPLSKHPDGRIFLARVSGGRNRDDAYFADDGPSITGDGHADAAFIAAANPAVILELIAELRQTQAERDWLARILGTLPDRECPPNRRRWSMECSKVSCEECWLQAVKEATTND